jgi:hypothetical protein
MKRKSRNWIAEWADPAVAQDALDSDARQRAEIRRQRKFIKYVYDQLLGYGPRTNGIDQGFCVSLGEEALALLKNRRKS